MPFLFERYPIENGLVYRVRLHLGEPSVHLRLGSLHALQAEQLRSRIVVHTRPCGPNLLNLTKHYLSPTRIRFLELVKRCP